MENTITLPKRWTTSQDAAARVQEIQKKEECVEQHHKYTFFFLKWARLKKIAVKNIHLGDKSTKKCERARTIKVEKGSGVVSGWEANSRAFRMAGKVLW